MIDFCEAGRHPRSVLTLGVLLKKSTFHSCILYLSGVARSRFLDGSLRYRAARSWRTGSIQADASLSNGRHMDLILSRLSSLTSRRLLPGDAEVKIHKAGNDAVSLYWFTGVTILFLSVHSGLFQVNNRMKRWGSKSPLNSSRIEKTLDEFDDLFFSSIYSVMTFAEDVRFEGKKEFQGLYVVVPV